MKELDVVLERYFYQDYKTVSSQERARFRELLDMDDPGLYAMLLGRAEVPEEWAAIMEKLRGN